MAFRPQRTCKEPYCIHHWPVRFRTFRKPNLTYTNYLYVQLLSDFIKSEIGHRTDIVATGAAASLAVMACGNSPELFDRLILVNPESLLSCSMVPGKNAKLYKFILDLPIVGTLIYHIASSRQNIADDLKITISLIRTLSLPGILTLTTKQHI